MKRRLPLLLMLAAMAAAVVFCVLWRQAAADRSQLTDLARSGAAEAVRRFSDYQSRGDDRDYWSGVAAFHTFQQASALLPEDGAEDRAICSAVYGSLLLSPDRAKEHLPELIAIAVTAGLHLWKRNTLISIGAGTVVYMLLVQLVFA